jgi:L-aminopeptidase/D-esterase-like protein
VAEGNLGAGAGGTVGRMLQRQGMRGMKGGLGTASLRLGEVAIGALAIVNAADRRLADGKDRGRGAPRRWRRVRRQIRRGLDRGRRSQVAGRGSIDVPRRAFL